MVELAEASDCSARTKSREAGTAKWADSAARSAHCSMNTSRSGFSQSTCTACEMQPGSPRERCTCSRLSLRTSPKESSRAVTLHGVTKPVTFTLKGGRVAEFPKGVQRTGFSTELNIKRSDFGMEKFKEAVSDEVYIAISFEGTKK